MNPHQRITFGFSKQSAGRLARSCQPALYAFHCALFHRSIAHGVQRCSCRNQGSCDHLPSCEPRYTTIRDASTPFSFTRYVLVFEARLSGEFPARFSALAAFPTMASFASELRCRFSAISSRQASLRCPREMTASVATELNGAQGIGYRRGATTGAATVTVVVAEAV